MEKLTTEDLIKSECTALDEWARQVAKEYRRLHADKVDEIIMEAIMETVKDEG